MINIHFQLVIQKLPLYMKWKLKTINYFSLLHSLQWYKSFSQKYREEKFYKHNYKNNRESLLLKILQIDNY